MTQDNYQANPTLSLCFQQAALPASQQFVCLDYRCNVFVGRRFLLLYNLYVWSIEVILLLGWASRFSTICMSGPDTVLSINVILFFRRCFPLLHNLYVWTIDVILLLGGASRSSTICMSGLLMYFCC